MPHRYSASPTAFPARRHRRPGRPSPVRRCPVPRSHTRSGARRYGTKRIGTGGDRTCRTDPAGTAREAVRQDRRRRGRQTNAPLAGAAQAERSGSTQADASAAKRAERAGSGGIEIQKQETRSSKRPSGQNARTAPPGQRTSGPETVCGYAEKRGAVQQVFLPSENRVFEKAPDSRTNKKGASKTR